MNTPSLLLFEVVTPLGFSVRTAVAYWERLTAKHPDVADKVEEVKAALRQPEQVRQSRRDPSVFLFHHPGVRHWVVAVTRQTDGTGFLVTAYQTDAIKEGEKIWPK